MDVLSPRCYSLPRNPSAPAFISRKALPLAGTASYGLHAAPPFGVVDPDRPEPLTLVVRGAGGWPRE